MLLINKPAGLLSQGDRTGDVDVSSLAREYVRVAARKPGEAFVALVHRLDRPGDWAFSRAFRLVSRVVWVHGILPPKFMVTMLVTPKELGGLYKTAGMIPSQLFM